MKVKKWVGEMMDGVADRVEYFLEDALSFIEVVAVLIIIYIAIISATIGLAVWLGWAGAGKQAEIYNATTGKNITQRDMFWGSEMFYIRPSDIKERAK